IKTAMKTLDDMAKGRVPFAKEKARKAAFSIEYQAVLTPDLFREAASDPKSEARPEIWERFEDFVQKSEQMKAAAQHAAQNINDIASIRASLVKMGKTCKACHSDYRQK
ncbi:MAG: cytochrome c, partial [Cohaesibacter sp.]|nr:cytochrome c [Cohaesibacter sp.]